MKHSPLLLIAAATCAALASPVSARPSAGFGQVATLDRLRVRPLALLEDSRCPASVQCVWAGQVRIRAEITSRNGRKVREMTLGQPIAVAGGILTLTSAEPPKLAPGTTNPRRYRFTFLFAR